jgi:hypothetical protein
MNEAECLFRNVFGELCRIVTARCPVCGDRNYAMISESLAELCDIAPLSDQMMMLAAFRAWGFLKTRSGFPIPCDRPGCCRDIPSWEEVSAPTPHLTQLR